MNACSPTLSELEEVGLVVREVDAGPPLRVNYGLAEADRAFHPALLEVDRWAERCLPESGPCVEAGPAGD